MLLLSDSLRCTAPLLLILLAHSLMLVIQLSVPCVQQLFSTGLAHMRAGSTCRSLPYIRIPRRCVLFGSFRPFRSAVGWR